MDVLCHFQLLNLQGKLMGFSFYHALEYQTNNLRLTKLLVSKPKLNHDSMLTRLFIGSPPIVHAHCMPVQTYQDVEVGQKSL